MNLHITFNLGFLLPPPWPVCTQIEGIFYTGENMLKIILGRQQYNCSRLKAVHVSKPVQV